MGNARVALQPCLCATEFVGGWTSFLDVASSDLWVLQETCSDNQCCLKLFLPFRKEYLFQLSWRIASIKKIKETSGFWRLMQQMPFLLGSVDHRKMRILRIFRKQIRCLMEHSFRSLVLLIKKMEPTTFSAASSKPAGWCAKAAFPSPISSRPPSADRYLASIWAVWSDDPVMEVRLAFLVKLQSLQYRPTGRKTFFTFKNSILIYQKNRGHPFSPICHQ